MIEFLLVVSIVIISLCIYLIADYYGPATIRCRKGIDKNNLKQYKELIAQEYDSEGNLWASRGMILYRMKKGDNVFKRVAHIPSGWSFYWLYNFSIFRKFVNKPECVVVTISDNQHICAMSAGIIWYKQIQDKKFTEVFQMRYFGMGVGRGIFSNGMVSVNKSEVYFGEYFRNPSRTDVRIYKSRDHGKTWDVAYEFEAKNTRHVHGIQKDPYTGRLWVTCGDLDHESFIAYTEDGFKTIHEVGRGSQKWRTCHLIFKQDYIYWGADTGSVEEAGVYRLDRKTNSIDKVCSVKGAILYGAELINGDMVFCADREGFENEEDDVVRLIEVQSEHGVNELKVGSWKHSKKNFRYSFAMLRTPRNSGANTLCFSVINQKEYPMGEMILVEADHLHQLTNHN